MNTYLLNRYVLTVLLLATISACTSKTTVEPQPTAQQYSGVLQTEDGFAIPEATIQALDASNEVVAADTTDALGNFHITANSEDPSRITLRVSHPEYKSTSIALKELVGKSGGQGAGLAVILENDSCCGVLSISVTSHDVALGEATVTVKRGDHTIASGVTNGDGHAVFHHICPGNLHYSISKNGYTTQNADFTMSDCDSVGRRIALVANSNQNSDSCCTGVLVVNVRDSSTQEPATNVSVRITRGGVAHTLTAEHGVVTFRELCDGSYAIRIAREHDYVVQEFSVSLGCSDSLSINRTLVRTQTSADSCCGGSITLLVRDSASGQMLSSGTATLWSGSTQVASGSLTANGLVFNHLCQGTYQVSLSKEGYNHIEFNVEVGCNSQVTRDPHMSQTVVHHDTCCTGVVQLVLRDSTTHLALSGATVRIYRSGVLLETGTTNGDGGVGFDGICEGAIRMTINHDGYAERVVEFNSNCTEVHHVSTALIPNANNDCCTGTFRVHLIDLDHQDSVLSGVTVTVTGGGSTLAHGTTNGEGNFTAEHLCSHSSYTVTFSKDGYHSSSMTLSTTDCHAYTETIRLQHN